MTGDMHSAVLIAVMAACTILLRALPFIVFRNNTPGYVIYLGEVLPPALIGMLVIYCLREVSFTAAPFGIPEVIAASAVIALQAWRRNSVVSILTGTAVYMILMQTVF